MDASKPKYAIQLKEHLQYQQEPFSLQNYLVERSYMFKSCNSDLYFAKNLRWSIKYDLQKKRKRFLHATRILRTLVYKFIPTVDSQEFSNWDEEHNSDGQTNELFSLKRLAASDHITNNDDEDKVLHYEHHSSTLEDIFQTFTLPKLTRSEVETGSQPYWISSKENEQQSSKGTEWRESLPNAVYHQKSPESYLRKLLANSNILKFGGAKKDKLQDREFHENEEGKRVSKKAVSESEDLHYIIHERFSLLEKQYRQVKKISHLVQTESQEWENMQIVNREKIEMEIGDAIMDDIVREIIDLF